MEFFRKHRKAIVFILSIMLVAWMVGLSAVVAVIMQ